MREKGFTFIEVSLFLALSGAILIGILAGITSTLSNQRYTASVQDFAEFLRSVYTDVENPHSANSSGGTSSQVLYGRLIAFGENNSDTIHIYNVIGNDTGRDSGTNDIEELKTVNLAIDTTSDVEEHNVLWGAVVRDTTKNQKAGGVLIVRMPSTGKVKTFWLNKKPLYDNAGKVDFGSGNAASYEQDIDFCVHSDDAPNTDRNIRIHAKGANADAVEIIDLDSGDNKCAG